MQVGIDEHNNITNLFIIIGKFI